MDLRCPLFDPFLPDAGQRRHDLREVFNAALCGAYRLLVADATQRLAAVTDASADAVRVQGGLRRGCLHDLRMLLRLARRVYALFISRCSGCRTLQSTPISSARAGYDGARHKNSSIAHLAGRRTGPSASPARRAGRGTGLGSSGLARGRGLAQRLSLHSTWLTIRASVILNR